MTMSRVKQPTGFPTRFDEHSAGVAIGAIWLLWLFFVLLLALLRPMFDAGLLAELAAILHAVLTLAVLYAVLPSRFSTVLSLSLLIRIALVYWDLFFRDVYELINSGADTEMFYAFSVAVSEDLNLLSEDIRGGTYSKSVGVLFYLIGPSRFFAQYTNSLLGLTTVLVVYATLRRFDVSQKNLLRIMIVGSLLPNSLILSAIFLRESLVAVALAMSLYYFTRWFQAGSLVHVGLSISFVLAASAFHSGVIGIALGYAAAFLLYDRARSQIRLGVKNLPALVVLAGLLLLTATRYPDIFLGKFEEIDSTETLFESTNRRAGGSAYLEGLEVDSYGDLIVLGPLRSIYFLGSPLPWDFRGVKDLATFLVDSAFYLGVVSYGIVRASRGIARRVYTSSILASALVFTVVYGAGVGNAGTAIRHRYKILAFLLVLVGTSLGNNAHKHDTAHEDYKGSDRAKNDGGKMVSRRPRKLT